MADKKISALDPAITPLAGTEVLPIVQSGVTKKVSVDNLTAGKAVFALSINKIAITAPATGSTLTIADGKTLTANNSIALSGTDATTMTFPTTSATIARIDAAQSFTGDQTLATGNLVIGTSGKGIDFSADGSAAGMTSELLDDYEEGTWTPVAADAATGGNASATVGTGTYTKVGRMVTVAGAIANIDTTGLTAGNSLYIRGFPFSTANIYTGSADLRDITFTDYPITFMTGSSFRLFEHTSGGSITAITVSDLTAATSDIYFSLTYEVI